MTDDDDIAWTILAIASVLFLTMCIQGALIFADSQQEINNVY